MHSISKQTKQGCYTGEKITAPYYIIFLYKQENSDINNVGTTPLPPSFPPPIPPYVPTERTPSAYLTIISSLAEDDSPPPSLPPRCLPKEVASCTTENTPLDQPNDTTSSSLNTRKVSASGITTATNVAYFAMDILKESPLSSEAPCETSATIDQCSAPSQNNSTDKEEQEVSCYLFISLLFQFQYLN